MTIEGVIFDYGGVISVGILRDLGSFERMMGYPEGSVHRLMFGDPDRIEDDYVLLETGEITLEQYLQGIERRAPDVIGQPIDFSAYIEFTRQTPVQVHWPVVHRITQLRDEGVSLALLTNNAKEFKETWRATFPVEDLFPVVVDSCEVGMRKPDPRIYELTCERLGIAPTAAVFVDDNVENIEAAGALGLETVLFGTDPVASLAELDAILERRGIKPR
jgi:epoxide hydrolase-like predicted phosphatase